MKLLPALAATVLLASPAFAVTFGGTVTASFDLGSVNLGPGAHLTSGSYTAYGVEGSLGFTLGGNIGVQLDAGYARANGSEYDYYTASAYSLHVYIPVGQYRLGAFYGFGIGDSQYESDEGHVTYYGVEAATSFGANDISVQIGLMSSDNSHNPLNYDDAFLANVEWRHFVNDNFMIRGSAGLGNFLTHGDPGTGVLISAEAMFAIRGNLYATIGLSDFIVTNEIRGQYNDISAFVGITMAFGGSGSLRDAMSATPMIATMLPSLVAIASSAVD